MAHLTKESAFLLLFPALFLLRDRKAWPIVGTAAVTFLVVAAVEMALYGFTMGDPFLRLRSARMAQEGLNTWPGWSGFGLWKRLLLEVPSFLWNPLGPFLPYTGGLFLWTLAGLVWAFRRDRARSGWMTYWFIGTALFLAFWPISIVPYRPAMLLHPRVFAPLVVPGAVLAAAFFVSRLAVMPKIAWMAGGLSAVFALVCAVRLHEDALRWRRGVEWSRTQLAAYPGSVAVTDRRGARMIRMMEAYRPPFEVREYEPGTSPPMSGTLLLEDDRSAATLQAWEGIHAPPWWKGGEPPRETIAELVLPGRWRLRGPRGEPERVTLRRVR